MHKKKLIIETRHNSLPSRSKPVEPKAELSTFFGIGTEEIRKSIEALDRMLDQYDGDTAGQEASGSLSSIGSEKRFAPPKADPAAHLLASCMKAAGGHKLRKSSAGPGANEEDLPLPPPPPELLQRNASWAGTLPLNHPQSMDFIPARTRPAPVVPKRDPETRLTSSSSSDATAFTYQYSKEEDFEAGSIQFSSYGQKRHPESGYITPDQETIDSIFLGCPEKSGGLKMSQPSIHHLLPSAEYNGSPDMESAFIRKSVASQSDMVFPLPPAEFGDSTTPPPVPGRKVNHAESHSSVSFLRNSAASGNQGSHYANLDFSSHHLKHSYPTVYGDQHPSMLQKTSADYDFLSGQWLSGSPSASRVPVVENGPYSASSISPYLACIVPPPPLAQNFMEAERCSDSIVSAIGIVPPPPPMHHILPSGPPLPPSSFPPTFFSQDLNFSGTEDFPSPTKLPPPPTLPKQLKKTLPLSDSSSETELSQSNLPFKVNLKPVAVGKNQSKLTNENEEAVVYAVPTRSSSKRSSPTAASALSCDAFQKPAHYPPALDDALCTTAFPAPPVLSNPVFQVPPHVLLPPPPLPLAPPPPPPLAGLIPGPRPRTQPLQPNPPPLVPTKSWTPVPPLPPPLPGMEISEQLLEEQRSCTGLSLASALQSVRLHSAVTNSEKPSPCPTSPSGSRAALISQIQTGIQLRKSANGAKIRQTHLPDSGEVIKDSSGLGCDNAFDIQSAKISGSFSTSSSSSTSSITSASSIAPASGNSSTSGLTSTSGNSSASGRSSPFSSDSLMSRDMLQQSSNEVPLEITKMPGYQEIPPNCPTWKRAMIEKKNKQLEEDAVREMLTKKQEEERWRDIPEWKRNLIMDKEKKKLEELAPYQAERKRQEGEIEWLQSLPEWKRNLIIKKRGDSA